MPASLRGWSNACMHVWVWVCARVDPHAGCAGNRAACPKRASTVLSVPCPCSDEFNMPHAPFCAGLCWAQFEFPIVAPPGSKLPRACLLARGAAAHATPRRRANARPHPSRRRWISGRPPTPQIPFHYSRAASPSADKRTAAPGTAGSAPTAAARKPWRETAVKLRRTAFVLLRNQRPQRVGFRGHVTKATWGFPLSTLPETVGKKLVGKQVGKAQKRLGKDAIMMCHAMMWDVPAGHFVPPLCMRMRGLCLLLCCNLNVALTLTWEQALAGSIAKVWRALSELLLLPYHR